jgi:2-amino-4-hydroxy-6-hydroxymethyldihydropteridine diphosphokinase
MTTLLYGIALGSNLGNRATNLREGVKCLLAANACMKLIQQAPVFETDPVDCPPDSLPFLNSLVEVSSSLAPLEMLALTQSIESQLGRPRLRQRNAPRPLDLDLLYAGDCILQHPKLILPHPRLHLRRFVLAPLACIRPELILPGHEKSIRTYLDELQDDTQSVRQLSKE